MPTATNESFCVPVTFAVTEPTVPPVDRFYASTLPDLLPMPFDWHSERSVDEWKDVAMKFARMWSAQNSRMLVDPSYIHWLSATVSDGKLFRIDDQQLRNGYVNWLDRRRDVG